MPTGLWIVLALAAIGFMMFRSKGAGAARDTPEKSDLWTRWKQRDAMTPDVVKEGVRLAEALPIVDEGTSWLLHEPVYDARTDMFDPPCSAPDFEYSSGRCWTSREALADVFRSWAEFEAAIRLELMRPRTSSVIAASDHIDIVACLDSVNEPGVRVVRLSRVAADRWHTHVWTCGLAPGAGAVALGTSDGRMRMEFGSDSAQTDPPLRAADIAEDPSLWTRRNAQVRERWPTNGDWRDAAQLCTHRK